MAIFGLVLFILLIKYTYAFKYRWSIPIAKGSNNTVYHKKVPDYASFTPMITGTFMVLYFLNFIEYLRARSLYFLNFLEYTRAHSLVFLVTCAWKLTVPGSSPAASYVQR